MVRKQTKRVNKKLKRDKKAQSMSIKTIIMLVLALTVLVILIMVFRGQINKSTQQYLGIGDDAVSDAKNTDKCETLFDNRICVKDETECGGKDGVVVSAYTGCIASKSICCQR